MKTKTIYLLYEKSAEAIFRSIRELLEQLGCQVYDFNLHGTKLAANRLDDAFFQTFFTDGDNQPIRPDGVIFCYVRGTIHSGYVMPLINGFFRYFDAEHSLQDPTERIILCEPRSYTESRDTVLSCFLNQDERRKYEESKRQKTYQVLKFSLEQMPETTSVEAAVEAWSQKLSPIVD